MTNAFTQKPDLTQFLKKARVSRSASAQGRKISENPTPEQRALMFSQISPKKK
jgi:hypothetical protein